MQFKSSYMDLEGIFFFSRVVTILLPSRATEMTFRHVPASQDTKTTSEYLFIIFFSPESFYIIAQISELVFKINQSGLFISLCVYVFIFTAIFLI